MRIVDRVETTGYITLSRREKVFFGVLRQAGVSLSGQLSAFLGSGG